MAHRIAYIPQTHAPAFRFSVRDMVLMGTTHRISPLSAPKRMSTEPVVSSSSPAKMLSAIILKN